MSRFTRSTVLPAALAACLLSACTGGGGDGPGVAGVQLGSGRTFLIKPTATATDDMAAAMTLAAPGDVIQFDCGFFDLSETLQLINTEAVTIKGCGIDKTVLSFRGTSTPEGILAVNVGGLLIQDLTVLDTAGNGIELRAVNHGTLQRVRAIWSSGGGRKSSTLITAENYDDTIDGIPYRLLNVPCTDPPTLNPEAPENEGGDTTSPDYTVSKESGRYGMYPVSSDNILIEASESVGASDAGIYVGQTSNAIIRNSRAAYNVFGMEIENVRNGEYDSNVAECNTGGFLIYDLDNLRQYGDRSRMHGNISRNNNTYNFTAGGFVANVPRGSGMITLSYDRIDIYDNEFRDNSTGGIIHASYELFPPGDRPSEHRIDWYSEGVHIFRNKFFNNGNDLPPPNTNDMQSQDLPKLLPALVGFKNQAACTDPRHPENAAICAAAGPPGGYRGAHIVWDGLLDTLDAGCAYPKRADGSNVTPDERGKPLHGNEDPDPECHYNAYKFAATGERARIVPDWFASCIDADNEFSADSLKFSNFKGTKGVNAVITEDPALIGEAGDFPASFDMSAHECPTAYGKNLPLLPDFEIPPFTSSGDYDPAPSAERIAQLCGATPSAGQANFAAAPVNCPRLDQYHLFADEEDPRSAPNGGGVPFSLNSKLFSDYAVKYRVAYLPPGSKAIYKDGTDGVSANLTFPTGTIIAKTFAFRDEDAGTEIPVETRLLIKRQSSSGRVRWDGIPYLWGTVGGKRVATLATTGATASVHWDLSDVDSGAHYTGSTGSYRIPNINQCISCHSNADKEPGASPIGLKVRNLNGPFRPESAEDTDQAVHAVAGKNQLQYWRDAGLLQGGPADFGVNATTQIAANAFRLPIYNKVGDGDASDPKKDVEARARAWLEVNCQHCHTVRGYAGSTGLFLDVFRKVDAGYGICKSPTATGAEGSGGRAVDIHPGDASKSIMEFRIGTAATTPAARMPPIARSVVDEAGHALIAQWINTVVDATYENGGCANEDGGGPPLP